MYEVKIINPRKCLSANFQELKEGTILTISDWQLKNNIDGLEVIRHFKNIPIKKICSKCKRPYTAYKKKILRY